MHMTQTEVNSLFSFVKKFLSNNPSASDEEILAKFRETEPSCPVDVEEVQAVLLTNSTQDST